MLRILFGSQNSLDLDVAYVFSTLPTLQECKSFCSDKIENRNIVVIEDGRVIQSYKGTVDEMNNVLFYTFDLHKQEVAENPVKILLPRDKMLKNIRTIRGLLSELSRTSFREQIKLALRSDWITKLNVLAAIDLNLIEDFGKTTIEDGKKFLAFQLGQTMALNDDIEVYTKDCVGKLYPSMSKYLNRQQETSFDDLDVLWKEYVNYLFQLDVKSKDDIIEYQGVKYNLKTEHII